jgi:hypothetical protein
MGWMRDFGVARIDIVEFMDDVDIAYYLQEPGTLGANYPFCAKEFTSGTKTRKILDAFERHVRSFGQQRIPAPRGRGEGVHPPRPRKRPLG